MSQQTGLPASAYFSLTVTDGGNMSFLKKQKQCLTFKKKSVPLRISNACACLRLESLFTSVLLRESLECCFLSQTDVTIILLSGKLSEGKVIRQGQNAGIHKYVYTHLTVLSKEGCINMEVHASK